MGLKCSVLGHAYGETTVERDREEQGSEVVITIREVEICDRCGTDRVVSENKEVTSIETPDDEGELGTDESGVTDADDPSTDDEASATEDAAEQVAAGEELSASEIVGDEGDEEQSPPEGDEPDTGAEILDAESEEPVEADEPVDEELADPTVDPAVDTDDAAVSESNPVDGGDTADDVEEAPDDAVIIDEDDEEPVENGERQPGEWPEEPDSGDDEWQPDTIGTIEEDDEGEQATEATTLTVPDGQFRCPECEFTTMVESSSLRRGDFCPECRRGSLVHEPQDETRKE